MILIITQINNDDINHEQINDDDINHRVSGNYDGVDDNHVLAV